MKAYRRLFVAVLLFAAAAVPAVAGQAPGRDLALCVGAVDYQNFPKLETPFHDTYALAGELESYGDFRRIIVLSDKTEDGKPNQTRFLPVRKNVTDMLDLLARTASPGANVFIYLSGYGQERDGVAEFLPVDASDRDALSLTEIAELMKDSRAGGVFILFDAATPAGGAAPLGAAVDMDKLTVVFSRDAGQEPVVDAATGRGLFSMAVEDLVLSLAGNYDLNGDELLSRVNRYMSDYCLDKYIMAGQCATLRGVGAAAPVLRTREQRRMRTASAAPARRASPPPAPTPEFGSGGSAGVVPAVRPVAPARPTAQAGQKAENLRLKGIEHFRAREYDRAQAAFSQAAELGDPVSETYIGDMHMDALGVARDFAGALRHYSRAADMGYAVAQDSLGFMLERGAGIAADAAAAAGWYEKAAKQGDAVAEFHLARLLTSGEGTKKDAARAKTLFNSARQKGVIEILKERAGADSVCGMYSLGLLYQEGGVVARDMSQAAHWFRLAGEKEPEESAMTLGNLFQSQNNPEQAATFFRMSADNLFSSGK